MSLWESVSTVLIAWRVRHRVETCCHCPLWRLLATTTGAMLLLRNRPQPATVFLAPAYRGVETSAERSAPALDTSQLLGAVQKTQTFLGALAENPLCAGFLVHRFCKCVGNLCNGTDSPGGISVRLKRERNKKVLLCCLPTSGVVPTHIKE